MSDAINATGLDGWNVDDQGYLELFPLVTFSTGTSPDGCIVRLQYAETEQQWKDNDIRAVQLHLKPDQARALSQSLAAMADRIDQGLGGVPKDQT